MQHSCVKGPLREYHSIRLSTIRMHSQRLGGVGGVAAYTQTNRKGWKKGKVDGPVTLSWVKKENKEKDEAVCHQYSQRLS